MTTTAKHTPVKGVFKTHESDGKRKWERWGYNVSNGCGGNFATQKEAELALQAHEAAARCERLEAEKAALHAVLKSVKDAGYVDDGYPPTMAWVDDVLASTTPDPLYAAAPEMLKGYELTIRDINILGQMLLGITRKDKSVVESILERQVRHQFTIAKATRTGKEGK